MAAMVCVSCKERCGGGGSDLVRLAAQNEGNPQLNTSRLSRQAARPAAPRSVARVHGHQLWPAAGHLPRWQSSADPWHTTSNVIHKSM